MRLSNQSQSSLLLEVLLYFNSFYAPLLFVIMAFEYIWKGVVLPYDRGFFALEIILMFLWLFVDWSRVWLASKGNKVEVLPPLIYSFALAGFSIIGNVFWLLWQTYVTRLDVVIHAIALAFTGAEVALMILVALSFMARK